MITGLLSPFRTPSKVLVLIGIAAFILASCRGSPDPAVETMPSAQPTQLPAQELQPTATPPPADTQAPAATQAAAPTLVQPVEMVISACDLVTPEEAEAALGVPIGEPVEENYPPLYGCRYEASSLNHVGISLTVFDSEEQAADAFQLMVSMNDYEEVSGIGDRAVRLIISDIDVLKGRYDLIIDVVDDSDDEAQYQKARELAEIALTRLP